MKRAVLLGGPDDGLEIRVSEPLPLTLRTVQTEQPFGFEPLPEHPEPLNKRVAVYVMTMRMAKPCVDRLGRIVYRVES